MTPKTLFLVCNAHLDPVWLWQWEEGLAETLSTFRTAARFCEEFEGFVFCHNEALLYQWVADYEPELFETIAQLVASGRWHVMGGWYLQPDCNLPSGESFVRQILVGKRFFAEKLGTEPTCAVNLDPFGHSRGLVQILAKSGYSSYLFCRPGKGDLELPGDDFVWVGYDRSELLAHRAPDHYNSTRGQAAARIEDWLAKNCERGFGLLLWGIGNHGGGPSREDLTAIAGLAQSQAEGDTSRGSQGSRGSGDGGEGVGDTSLEASVEARDTAFPAAGWRIQHATPEDYFERLDADRATLTRWQHDLNPWAVGCYTSMALVKQAHRRLESRYSTTEKMLAEAALQGLCTYPRDELKSALEDLLFCEFHDVLPGSAIVEAERDALQRMDHGLEILSRQRARAFFAQLAGQRPAAEGEFPIFVYNPHPYELAPVIVCEFQPPEPNFDKQRFLQPTLSDVSGHPVPSQVEKESANIATDQRKRVVFQARLGPSSMTRFACRLDEVPSPAGRWERYRGESLGRTPGGQGDRDSACGFGDVAATGDELRFTSDFVEVVINLRTGLIDRYRVGGRDFVKPGAGACVPLVMRDDPDPWGMKVRGFTERAGAFALMSPEQSAAFAGVEVPRLAPVRIIEDGPIRTVVEALFEYNRSALCMRYTIPKRGSEIEVAARVFWFETDRMLKLAVPTTLGGGSCLGEVAYGVEEFARRDEELVAQRWVALRAHDRTAALTIVSDGSHGFDHDGAGTLRLSLLRSPAHAGHPVEEGLPILRQDRFEGRIDLGERCFRFWLDAGPAEQRLAHIAREAQVRNEPPMVLCAFPPGGGGGATQGGAGPCVVLTDPVALLTAFKMAEEGERLVVRLFEPTGEARRTRLVIPSLDVRHDVELQGFEIITLAVDLKTKEISSVDLLERPWRNTSQP